MLSLVNLRLDVAILGALVGPGTLGIYAVASKYAELLRLPGLAITYVLYPRLAARDREEASRAVVALLPRALVFTVLAAIPLAVAVPLLPLCLRAGVHQRHAPRLHPPVRAHRRGRGRPGQRLPVRGGPAGRPTLSPSGSLWW